MEGPEKKITITENESELQTPGMENGDVASQHVADISAARAPLVSSLFPLPMPIYFVKCYYANILIFVA